MSTHPIGANYFTPQPSVPRIVQAQPPVVPWETVSLVAKPRSKSVHVTKRMRVVRLAEVRGSLTTAEVMEELEVSQDAAHKLLSRATEEGSLRRVEQGLYEPSA